MNPLAAAKLVAIALVASLLFFGGRSCGRQSSADELTAIKLQHAEEAAEIARLTQVALQKARAAERAQAEAFLAIGDAYEKGKDDAFQRGKDAAAAVRTGTVQLQDHWGCPKPAARVPEAHAGTGQRDEGAELRAAGAGDLVQVGADADAQLRACQAVVVALGGAPEQATP